MAQRRNGTAFFAVTLLALSGTAFFVGNRLRENLPHGAGMYGSSQIAQARTGRYALHVESPSPRSITRTDDAEDARRTFDTVYSLVKQHYVDKLPSDRTMSQSAVRAMIASLNDPNCYFLEPEQFALLNSEERGRFSGIGATLLVRGQKHDGYTDYKIVVVSALPGSPAEKAGLLPGDTITHIDGKWVLGYDPFLKANLLAEKSRKSLGTADTDSFRQEYETARKKVQGGIGLLKAQLALRGDSHTLARLGLAREKRVLTILRPGLKQPQVLEMDVRPTEIAPLLTRTLSDGTGYIHIPLFTEQTIDEFKQAISTLPKEHGLILDLRGNSGGLLEAAMAVESMLSPGSAFGFQLMTGGRQSPLKPTGSHSNFARPVVLLVDRGTASVAEALAASLVDAGIATTVGGKTFGDSTVQMAYALPDGSAFVLTTGKMISPRRADWTVSGISPKVKVSPNTPEDQIINLALSTLRERTQVATSKTH